jgi:hypothetical protein
LETATADKAELSTDLQQHTWNRLIEDFIGAVRNDDRDHRSHPNLPISPTAYAPKKSSVPPARSSSTGRSGDSERIRERLRVGFRHAPVSVRHPLRPPSREVIRARVVRDGEFHQTGNAIMLKLRRERDWVPGNVAGSTFAASRANTSTTPSTSSSGPAGSKP